jgi:LmbE family N-acetylglucosaminyl deacetylase
LVERIIVFAAHPDDETLGCGGTILKRMSEGFEIIIVVMTDGRHSLSHSFGISSNPTPDELIQIRKKEFLKAAKVLNVPENNLLFFDFEDGNLAEHSVEAAKKVVEVLDQFKPVEVYYPYRKDSNKDHQAANRIIGDSVESMGFSTRQYQYSIAQTFSRIGPFVAQLLNYVLHHLVFVDISQFVGKKETAIRKYQSQTTIIANGQKRPVIADVNKFLKAREMFYYRS